MALTDVQDRSAGNDPTESGVANHTVFEKTGPTFDPSNIDFNRFDLAQWSVIDGLIADTGNRGIHVSALLAFNSSDFDYEEEYLAHRGTGFTPIQTPGGAAFAYRHEMYLWYVVGRLGAYTNVQWCNQQEWNVDYTSSSTPGDEFKPYDAESVRQIGLALAATDPYLTFDPDMRVVNDVAGRGSFYPDWQTLGDNVSPFLGTQDDPWRSCVGLHRGGELGITSIVAVPPAVDALESAGAPGGGYPDFNTMAHRSTLIANGTNRPIFIEEDWISKNDPADPNGDQVFVTGSFADGDNPYAKYHSGSPSNPNTNNNAFAFIDNNYEGLRKAIRDNAWISGVVCQAYTAFWTRKYRVS